MFPDYPFQGHYKEINGHRMHYIDEGDHDAPVLIMVHGNPSWSYYFRHLISTLSKTYRCIAPDHIGMGLSEKPEPGDYDFTLKNRIDDLDTLLTSLGISENITLIVHDWGGMIGMGYATRYPNQISRLIIMNTAAFLLPAKLKLPWQLIVGRSFLAPLLIKGFNAFCRGAVKSCVTRKAMDAQTANAYLAPYDNWGNRHAVFRFVQDIPMKPGDESYETVAEITNKLEQFKNLPVLILWGIQDFVFNEGFLDEWLKYLPHADVHRIEDAGHYVLEDAHDEIIPLVLKYLGDKQDVANC